MFYVVEITKVKEQPYAKAITEKETEEKAEMLFHQVMASALANDNLEEAICTVIDNNGEQRHDLTRHYIKPQPITGVVDVTNE